MEKENKSKKQLFEEIDELRIRLEESEETLKAIRSGEVDAIVVSGPQGDQVFTLTGAEQAYRVLIKTMNEGAASLNQEGMIIYCNHRLSEMIKTPLEKVIGTPMRQFIRASDLPVFDSLIEKGLQKSGKGEVAFIKNDGTVLPVLLSISALQRDNANMCGIIVTDLTAQKHIEEELRRHRDNLEELVKDRTNELKTSNQLLQEEITERKRSEELLHENRARLDLALRSASMGVWHWDIIENKRYFDDQSCHLLGINPATFTGSAEEFFRVLHPDDRETIKAALARTIEQDVLYEPEYRAVWPDGSVHYITARGRVVCDNKGRPLRINGILWDITERKQAEETIREYTENLEEKVRKRTRELEDINLELQVLNKELELRKQEAEDAKLQAEAATRAKSDFLANMSHELRTPLNAIIGFSDMMFQGMTGKLTEQQLEYLGDIRESGELLLSLINDILDLSKVEAGKMELELSEFNVKDLIERNMILFKEKAMKHRIKLTAEVPLDVELIEADERKIKQVIANLLSNAMKFTPDGGSVSVQARRVSLRGEAEAISKDEIPRYSRNDNLIGDFIEISVEDTGIGIRPEDFDKIFQPFQQLEYILNKKYEGTGLGLTLCERIVELHHGRIWVESEMGKGSKFIFVIPVRQGKNN